VAGGEFRCTESGGGSVTTSGAAMADGVWYLVYCEFTGSTSLEVGYLKQGTDTSFNVTQDTTGIGATLDLRSLGFRIPDDPTTLTAEGPVGMWSSTTDPADLHASGYRNDWEVVSPAPLSYWTPCRPGGDEYDPEDIMGFSAFNLGANMPMSAADCDTGGPL